LDCGDNGEKKNEKCSCFSGFTGKGCTQSFIQQCSLKAPSPTQKFTQPQVDTSRTFIQSNQLNLLVDIEPIRGRLIDTFSMNQRPTCSFPGKHFYKTFRVEDCLDVLNGGIALSELKEDCGFEEETDANSFTLSGSIAMVLRDRVGEFQGRPIWSSYPYAGNISIRIPQTHSLPIQLDVTSQVETEVHIKVAEYNYNTDSAHIIVESSIHADFQFFGMSIKSELRTKAELLTTACSSLPCMQESRIRIPEVRRSVGCDLNHPLHISFNAAARDGEGEVRPEKWVIRMGPFRVCADLEFALQFQSQSQ